MINLIQAPFVQLNSPYPAVYYLKSFLNANDIDCTCNDHSIELFKKIFCAGGLKKIFADAKKIKIANCKEQTSSATEAIALRFFSEEQLWINNIEHIVNFLCGRDREFAYYLTMANGFLPGGPRSDAFIQNCATSNSIENAFLMASKMIADIADFITEMLDPYFSLVSYGGNLQGASVKYFDDLDGAVNGYIMSEFYKPYLKENFLPKIKTNLDQTNNAKMFVGISIPFLGCLAGALSCAALIKGEYGDAVSTIAGGGYVSTELRSISDIRFFAYFDHIVYDQGYRDLYGIVSGKTSRSEGGVAKKRFVKQNLRSEGGAPPAITNIFPDYSGVNFLDYLFPLDDINPMHRLWSHGHWLKCYLAYGCYWHNCTFCDTQLDYICNYQACDVKKLFLHLKKIAETTGVRGVHFVDEAMPEKLLKEFALLNLEAGRPLIFWGNIRFDKSWNSGIAMLLSAAGLIGVSGGIEIATSGGLKKLCKGLTLDDIVFSAAAFKEAGILVHGYLMFGYYQQSEADIINSAENVRRLFNEGLLDSAFWHKFVLTCHSKLFLEWKENKHSLLQIVDENELDADNSKMVFARNDLKFVGDDNYNKYSKPLDAMLSHWMQGLTQNSVDEYFPFELAKPDVPKNNIKNILNDYAVQKESKRKDVPQLNGEKIIFLGSEPQLLNNKIFWRYRLEDHFLFVDNCSAEKLLKLIKAIAFIPVESTSFYKKIMEVTGEYLCKKVWYTLRSGGLEII
ncbi:MAG: radical SAM protein [Termitinemataceae bacterium]|nr:MAG: radical SAM protein [Termitinemataceae bacterium]